MAGQAPRTWGADNDEKEHIMSTDTTETTARQALGPQGEEVLALIEQAKHLTDDQASRLHAFPGATWAWNRLHAVSYGPLDGVRGAAVFAAQLDLSGASAEAGWRVPQAARDALQALVFRDQIGSRFTQAFYDDMTRPWRSIVGPIHPDDAPLNARAEREGVQR